MTDYRTDGTPSTVLVGPDRTVLVDAFHLHPYELLGHVLHADQHPRGLSSGTRTVGDTSAPAVNARGMSAGATQVFEADGGATYVENGRSTRAEWNIDDDGHFGSFWPPSYRASYDLRWMAEDGAIVGLRFTDLGRGSRFEGRYRDYRQRLPRRWGSGEGVSAGSTDRVRSGPRTGLWRGGRAPRRRGGRARGRPG